MNIQEAIKLAIENPHRWYEYDHGDRYPAGMVRGYGDGTIGIQDISDGEMLVLPISIFQVSVPAPVDYACDLSRAIDDCVRDARKVFQVSDPHADGATFLGHNPATDRVAFRYSCDGEEVIESVPADGWTTR